MRIAVDARPLSMPITGIGRYTSALLTEMIASGNEWFLYSDSPFNTELSNMENVTIRCGTASPASALGLRYSQFDYRFWLKQDQPDLFWSPRHHLPLWLNKRTPQVLTIHDVVWKRYPETMPWQPRMLERLLMPASVKQADKIICVSQFTATEVGTFWPEQAHKCDVIYSGALGNSDNDVFVEKEANPYILFVGTLEPRKNLPRLLGAFSKLVSEGRIKEDLVVVGSDGWGGVDLVSLVRSLKIEGRVSLKGYVSDNQLQHLYQGARCLVMPSIYEGFGLPVLEAMQFGVPVVVADAGSLPEITGAGGLLIDPLSENGIARAIEVLLNDEELYSRISEQAIKRSAEFSWQKAARETTALFDRVVAG